MFFVFKSTDTHQQRQKIPINEDKRYPSTKTKAYACLCYDQIIFFEVSA